MIGLRGPQRLNTIYAAGCKLSFGTLKYDHHTCRTYKKFMSHAELNYVWISKLFILQPVDWAALNSESAEEENVNSWLDS